MADVLFRDGYVLTMDRELGDFSTGDLHVRDGRIIAVAKHLEVPGAEIVEAAGHIVVPGFIDGHRHAWQSLLRGMACNWSFPQYMVEARAMYSGCFDAEAAYVANLIGGLESIDAGITTMVDHSHLQTSPEISDALVQGLLDSGVAGFFCYALQNVPDYLSEEDVDGKAVSELLTRPADDWHYANAERVRTKFFGDNNGLLRFGVALYEGTAYVPPELSQTIFERARQLNPALITGHWNAISKPGIYISSLRHLQEAGVFSTPTLLSHNNDLNDDDLRLMVTSHVGACTCPDTELGMGLGSMMARRFVQMGGAASLGMDITCYAQADMLRQAHLFLQVERNVMAKEAQHMPVTIDWSARAALELLTNIGARSLGLEKEIGSLTPGKRADVLLIQSAAMLGMPVNDPATLLFYTDKSDIKSVMVNGRFLKRDGRLIGRDENELRSQASLALHRVQKRYSQLPHEALQNAWSSMF